jgi:hypothetical protein
MRPSNVIPFPKREPSHGELEAYRRITRNWSPASKRVMFPEHLRRSTLQNGGDLPSSSEDPRLGR